MANEVDYKAVVQLALSEVGYQGTSTTSKYSYDLDHADNGGPFYNNVSMLNNSTVRLIVQLIDFLGLHEIYLSR